MASVSDPSDNVIIDVDANLGNVKTPSPAAISNRPKSQAYPDLLDLLVLNHQIEQEKMSFRTILSSVFPPDHQIE